jgi:parallel beta-helix repeat protein
MYFENENDLIFDNIEIGQLTLINCNNITMKNLEITHTSRGVLTINSNNCFYYNNSFHSNKASGIKIVNGNNIEILQNSIFNNFYGIVITGGNDICANNKITNNHIFQNDFSGVLIDFSRNSIIKNNIIEDNGDYQYFSKDQAGIDVSSYSYDNEISNNLLKNNNIGIIVTLSEDNVITYNSIEKSKIKNILLEFSYNNRIQYNNLYDDKNRKYFRNEEMRTNNWNNNYWENWIGFGPKVIWGDKLIERWGRTGPYYIPITWIRFDWYPAKEPYDI